MPFPFNYVEERQNTMPEGMLGVAVELKENHRLPGGTVVEEGQKANIYNGHVPGGCLMPDEVALVLVGSNGFTGIKASKIRYI